jgi:hypothetical protein
MTAGNREKKRERRAKTAREQTTVSSVESAYQRCADSGDTLAQVIHKKWLVLDWIQLQAMLEPNVRY